ncbi:MAG TPA: ribbon-helix-helix domain-containing protein [Deltaproteobacteria bacterium]|nr:ribbon-helix-helix domain-containing protein [Deltaproteobacteria bacterium]HXK47176.1 ribbon-helix-helix domain-containing protein [Deltaproteobacteria bacterium]
MKTTISIPDSVFKAAEKFAQRVGISRSQLFTDAVRKYLKDHENESVTKKLNKVYSKESSSLDPVAHHLQYLSILSVLSL